MSYHNIGDVDRWGRPNLEPPVQHPFGTPVTYQARRNTNALSISLEHVRMRMPHEMKDTLRARTIGEKNHNV